MQTRILLSQEKIPTKLIGTMGRPKLKPDQAKGMYVRVRVTKAERTRIRKRWKAAGAKNESTWIRDQLLGDQ